MLIRIVVIYRQQLPLIAPLFFNDSQGTRYPVLAPLFNHLQALINVDQPLSGALAFGHLGLFYIALKRTIFV